MKHQFKNGRWWTITPAVFKTKIMENLQYWLRTEEVNGGIEHTLMVTQIHQFRPVNCEEISEHEYNVWKERLNNRRTDDE